MSEYEIDTAEVEMLLGKLRNVLRGTTNGPAIYDTPFGPSGVDVNTGLLDLLSSISGLRNGWNDHLKLPVEQLAMMMFVVLNDVNEADK